MRGLVAFTFVRGLEPTWHLARSHLAPVRSRASASGGGAGSGVHEAFRAWRLAHVAAAPTASCHSVNCDCDSSGL